MSPETLIVETETVIETPEPPIIELKNVEVTFTSRTGSLFKPNKVYAVLASTCASSADRRSASSASPAVASRSRP